jgi:hypothetical protein
MWPSADQLNKTLCLWQLNTYQPHINHGLTAVQYSLSYINHFHITPTIFKRNVPAGHTDMGALPGSCHLLHIFIMRQRHPIDTLHHTEATRAYSVTSWAPFGLHIVQGHTANMQLLYKVKHINTPDESNEECSMSGIAAKTLCDRFVPLLYNL